MPSLSRFGETHGHETYRAVEQTEGGPLFEQLATEVRLEGQRHRIDDVRGKGTSNVVGFTDGATFEVSDHPAPDLDGMYVVLSVTHHAQFNPKDNGVTQGPATAYTNSFSCHRFEVPDGAGYDYAPPLRAKPRANGPMTATVVGPEGEEIHTDRHGRIKVRMHWDREGLARDDHETSCWVPVGQVWAGPGYGAVFIPRVGMDVVISFLAGDPDRPLCTGVVYDGSNQPPYPLPDSKTRSVIRTSSSPGGGGYNELSFEDAAGSEEVFLRAQRNLREVVKASHSTSVGGDQSITVGRERMVVVADEDTVRVAKGRIVREAAERLTMIGTGAASKDTLHVEGEMLTFLTGVSKFKVTPPTGTAGEIGPAGAPFTLVQTRFEGFSVNAHEMIHFSVKGGSSLTLSKDKIVMSTPGGCSITLGEDVTVQSGKRVTLSKTSGAPGSGELPVESALVLEGDKAELSAMEQITLKTEVDSSLKLDADARMRAGTLELLANGGKSSVSVAPASVTTKAAAVTTKASTITAAATGPMILTGTPLDLN